MILIYKVIKILELLNKINKLSQREIAAEVNVSVGTVNSIIKQLVQSDFIEVKKSGKSQQYIVNDKGLLFLEEYIKDNLKTKILVPENNTHTIKTAVILAAGEQHDFDKPVGFLKLGNKTIIERTIQFLNDCGIKDILIIAGYESHYYEALAKQHGNIRLLKNEHYRNTGTMTSLALAKEFITDDFLLIESDLVFEKKALLELIQNTNRNCLLITNESSSNDEVFVEIRDGYIFKMSKDRHQFNKIDGELIGISKISIDIYEKMLEEFSDNQNPYFNYEYALLDVAWTYSIGYVKLKDLIWTEIDTKWQYHNLLHYIYPKLHEKETKGG